MKTDEIVIQRHDRVTHGEYVASLEDGSANARLTWTTRNGARDVEHTWVPEALRGRGVAGQLVAALISDARSKGFKIIPSCSYVAAQFARHPEWAELRA